MSMFSKNKHKNVEKSKTLNGVLVMLASIINRMKYAFIPTSCLWGSDAVHVACTTNIYALCKTICNGIQFSKDSIVQNLGQSMTAQSCNSY